MVHEGKEVGRVTSAVPGLALAYVRVEVPQDAALEIGGAQRTATLTALCAPVAQGIEHQLAELGVARSNRAGRIMTSPQPPEAPPEIRTEPIEPRVDRLTRHGRRARLYAAAAGFVGVLVVLIILIAKNTRSVKLDWAFGSTHASLVWVVLAAAVLGWLLGIATAVGFRYSTRRRR